jgi:hypothetical protein
MRPRISMNKKKLALLMGAFVCAAFAGATVGTRSTVMAQEIEECGSVCGEQSCNDPTPCQAWGDPNHTCATWNSARGNYCEPVSVLWATYGPECDQPLDVTQHVSSVVGGYFNKNYYVRVEELGDPCVDTKKSFVAEYSCGGNADPKRAEISAEANTWGTTFSCP